MRTKQNLRLRIISTVLCATFLASELHAAPIALSGASPVLPQEQLLQHPEAMDVPLDFATLTEVHRGSKDIFIIHIQDAHSNVSGQQNLSSVLDALMEKYGVRLVLSEGGEGDCSLTAIKKVASPAVWKRVAKSFLLRGEIQGEEYLNLVSEHPMKIIGVEDMSLYDVSLENYAQLAQRRDKALNHLRKIELALDKVKNRLYPKSLHDYELMVKKGTGFEKTFPELLRMRQEAGLETMGPETAKLAEALKKESTLNLGLANLERGALLEELYQKGKSEELEAALGQDQKIGKNKTALLAHFDKTLNIAGENGIDTTQYENLNAYMDYLKTFAAIEMDVLLKELETQENELYEKDLEGDSALVRSVDRFVTLLRAAHEIRMTTDQHERFKAAEPDFGVMPVEGFLNRKLAEQGYFNDLIPSDMTLDEARKAIDDFYDSVSKRDEAFAQNIEKTLQAEGQKVAFLITGGYHTDHLKKLLKENGYGYAVLTPMVSSETNQKKYESLLLGNKAKKIVTVSTEEKAKEAHDLRPTLLTMPASGARLAALMQDAGVPKKEADEILSRRGFLKALGATAVTAALGLPESSEAKKEAPKKTLSPLNPKVLDGRKYYNIYQTQNQPPSKSILTTESVLTMAEAKPGLEMGTSSIYEGQCILLTAKIKDAAGKEHVIFGHLTPGVNDDRGRRDFNASQIETIAGNIKRIFDDNKLDYRSAKFSLLRLGNSLTSFDRSMKQALVKELGISDKSILSLSSAVASQYSQMSLQLSADKEGQIEVDVIGGLGLLWSDETFTLGSDGLKLKPALTDRVKKRVRDYFNTPGSTQPAAPVAPKASGARLAAGVLADEGSPIDGSEWKITSNQTLPEDLTVEEISSILRDMEYVSQSILPSISPEQIRTILSNITRSEQDRKSIMASDMVGLLSNAEVSYVGKGQNKHVYRVAGDNFNFIMAVKIAKNDGIISDEEISFLKALDGIVSPKLGGVGTTVDGRAWMIEEFIEGRTADDLRSAEQLTLPMRKKIISVMREIAAVMGGIVPADINPRNFIFNGASSSSPGTPMIVDVGKGRLRLFDISAESTWDTIRLLQQLLVYYGNPESQDVVGANDYIFEGYLDFLSDKQAGLQRLTDVLNKLQTETLSRRSNVPSVLEENLESFLSRNQALPTPDVRELAGPTSFQKIDLERIAGLLAGTGKAPAIEKPLATILFNQSDENRHIVDATHEIANKILEIKTTADAFQVLLSLGNLKNHPQFRAVEKSDEQIPKLVSDAEKQLNSLISGARLAAISETPLTMTTAELEVYLGGLIPLRKSLAELRILIVDDSNVPRLKISKQLSSLGVSNANVATASGADDAAVLITDGHYDLVFVDLAMKKADDEGLRLIQHLVRLNANKPGQDAPHVILISATNSDQLKALPGVPELMDFMKPKGFFVDKTVDGLDATQLREMLSKISGARLAYNAYERGFVGLGPDGLPKKQAVIPGEDLYGAREAQTRFRNDAVRSLPAIETMKSDVLVSNIRTLASAQKLNTNAPGLVRALNGLSEEFDIFVRTGLKSPQPLFDAINKIKESWTAAVAANFEKKEVELVDYRLQQIYRHATLWALKAKSGSQTEISLTGTANPREDQLVRVNRKADGIEVRAVADALGIRDAVQKRFQLYELRMADPNWRMADGVKPPVALVLASTAEREIIYVSFETFKRTPDWTRLLDRAALEGSTSIGVGGSPSIASQMSAKVREYSNPDSGKEVTYDKTSNKVVIFSPDVSGARLADAELVTGLLGSLKGHNDDITRLIGENRRQAIVATLSPIHEAMFGEYKKFKSAPIDDLKLNDAVVDIIGSALLSISVRLDELDRLDIGIDPTEAIKNVHDALSHFLKVTEEMRSFADRGERDEIVRRHNQGSQGLDMSEVTLDASAGVPAVKDKIQEWLNSGAKVTAVVQVNRERAPQRIAGTEVMEVAQTERVPILVELKGVDGETAVFTYDNAMNRALLILRSGPELYVGENPKNDLKTVEVALKAQMSGVKKILGIEEAQTEIKGNIEISDIVAIYKGGAPTNPDALGARLATDAQWTIPNNSMRVQRGGINGDFFSPGRAATAIHTTEIPVTFSGTSALSKAISDVKFKLGMFEQTEGLVNSLASLEKGITDPRQDMLGSLKQLEAQWTSYQSTMRSLNQSRPQKAPIVSSNEAGQLALIMDRVKLLSLNIKDAKKIEIGLNLTAVPQGDRNTLHLLAADRAVVAKSLGLEESFRTDFDAPIRVTNENYLLYELLKAGQAQPAGLVLVPTSGAGPSLYIPLDGTSPPGDLRRTIDGKLGEESRFTRTTSYEGTTQTYRSKSPVIYLNPFSNKVAFLNASSGARLAEGTEQADLPMASDSEPSPNAVAEVSAASYQLEETRLSETLRQAVGPIILAADMRGTLAAMQDKDGGVLFPGVLDGMKSILKNGRFTIVSSDPSPSVEFILKAQANGFVEKNSSGEIVPLTKEAENLVWVSRSGMEMTYFDSGKFVEEVLSDSLTEDAAKKIRDILDGITKEKNFTGLFSLESGYKQKNDGYYPGFIEERRNKSGTGISFAYLPAGRLVGDKKKEFASNYRTMLEALAAQINQKMAESGITNMQAEVGGDTTIDIVPVGVDKGFALDRVLNKFYPGGRHDVFFIGDKLLDGNDKPALKVAKWGGNVSGLSSDDSRIFYLGPAERGGTGELLALVEPFISAATLPAGARLATTTQNRNVAQKALAALFSKSYTPQPDANGVYGRTVDQKSFQDAFLNILRDQPSDYLRTFASYAWYSLQADYFNADDAKTVSLHSALRFIAELSADPTVGEALKRIQAEDPLWTQAEKIFLESLSTIDAGLILNHSFDSLNAFPKNHVITKIAEVYSQTKTPEGIKGLRDALNSTLLPVQNGARLSTGLSLPSLMRSFSSSYNARLSKKTDLLIGLLTATINFYGQHNMSPSLEEGMLYQLRHGVPSFTKTTRIEKAWRSHQEKELETYLRDEFVAEVLGNMADKSWLTTTTAGARLADAERQAALVMLASEKDVFFGFGDGRKMRLRAELYGEKSADHFAEMISGISGEVLREFGGHSYRVGPKSDENVRVFPATADPLGVALEINRRIVKVFTEERAFVRFQPGTDVTAVSTDPAIIAFEALSETEEYLPGQKEVRKANFALIKVETGQSVPEAITSLLRRNGIPDENAKAIPLFAPTMVDGVARKSLIPSWESKTAEELLSLLTERAEEFQGIAKERQAWAVVQGGGAVHNPRTRHEIVSPAEKGLWQRKITIARDDLAQTSAFAERMEKDYAALEPGALAQVIEAAISAKDGQKRTELIRGPPDNFYVVSSNGAGEWQVLLVKKSILAKDPALRRDFYRNRRSSKREGESEARFGFKQINSYFGPEEGNWFIKISNAGLLDALGLAFAEKTVLSKEEIFALGVASRETVSGATVAAGVQTEEHITVIQSSDFLISDVRAESIIQKLELLSQARYEGVEQASKESANVFVRAYSDHVADWSTIESKSAEGRAYRRARYFNELRYDDEKVKSRLGLGNSLPTLAATIRHGESPATTLYNEMFGQSSQRFKDTVTSLKIATMRTGEIEVLLSIQDTDILPLQIHQSKRNPFEISHLFATNPVALKGLESNIRIELMRSVAAWLKQRNFEELYLMYNRQDQEVKAASFDFMLSVFQELAKPGEKPVSAFDNRMEIDLRKVDFPSSGSVSPSGARLAVNGAQGLEAMVGGSASLNYMRTIQEKINPLKVSKTALYLGSAADISTLLALTDADQLILIDQIPAIKLEANEVAEFKDAFAAYEQQKIDKGYIEGKFIRPFRNLFPFIINELERIGAESIAASEDGAVLKISFDWNGRNRTLRVLGNKDVSSPEQLSNALQLDLNIQHVDYFLLKAGEYQSDWGLMGYELTKLVAEKYLNENGAFVLDKEVETKDFKDGFEKVDVQNPDQVVFGYRAKVLAGSEVGATVYRKTSARPTQQIGARLAALPREGASNASQIDLGSLRLLATAQRVTPRQAPFNFLFTPAAVLGEVTFAPGALHVAAPGNAFDVPIPQSIIEELGAERLFGNVQAPIVSEGVQVSGNGTDRAEVERIVRLVGRSLGRLVADATLYDASKTVEIRFVADTGLSSEDSADIEKLFQSVQRFAGGKVLWQIAQDPAGFQELAGSSDRERYGIVYMGKLTQELLDAAQAARAGVAAVSSDIGEEMRPVHFAQSVFSVLVQRMAKPTSELNQAWANLRADSSIELTPKVFGSLKIVSGSHLDDYLRLTFRIVALNWKQIMTSTYTALKAIGSAA